MIGMNQFLTDIPFSPFKLSFKREVGGQNQQPLIILQIWLFNPIQGL